MQVTLPFYMRRPELNLRPFSEFHDRLRFWFTKIDYVENPEKTSMKDYLWIVRKEKFGILYWHVKKGFLSDKNIYDIIIPCEFDEIKKFEDYFICYGNGTCEYRDLRGKVLT